MIAEYSRTENFFLMLVIAIVMVLAWYFLQVFINKKIGRTTRMDYDEAIKGNIAPVLMRVGIMYSIAWIITTAFGRFV